MRTQHTADVRVGKLAARQNAWLACQVAMVVAGCGGDEGTSAQTSTMAGGASPMATTPGQMTGSSSMGTPMSGMDTRAGSTGMVARSGAAGSSSTAPGGSTTSMAGAPASGGPGMPAAMGGPGTNGAAGMAAAPGAEEPGAATGSCLDMVTDYTMMGPFQFELRVEGAVYLWVPMVPPGCKVPVTQLANGTGAGCMNYEEINSYLASHGFLATCYDSPNTGSGDGGIMAIETAFELYPDLADHKIGSTGHSQGGQASFIVLQYAEAKWGPEYKYAGLAMEPASGFGAQPTQGTWAQIYGMIKSPMFMFSGTADTLVAAPWVGSAYSAMGDIEAYWWSAIGATHVPTPDAHTMQVSVPWFRWKLLGDKKACELFKSLPDGDQWDAVESKNEAPCE